jgi:hypothetical protein
MTGKRYSVVRTSVKIFSMLLIALAALYAPVASAIPALQIYSPDATYDAALETWVISDNTFELYVIGAVGDYGTIYDVTLAASYYGSSGNISIMPGLPTDTDYASKPGFTDGVQNHEEFKNADGHYFYDLGDFTSTSDTIYDYTSGGTGGAKQGEIKKFMVHVTGYDAVHFDAFDHYFTGRQGTASYQLHGVFAPFSHDATGGGVELPEPAATLLLVPGLIGLALYRRRR